MKMFQYIVVEQLRPCLNISFNEYEVYAKCAKEYKEINEFDGLCYDILRIYTNE